LITFLSREDKKKEAKNRKKWNKMPSLVIFFHFFMVVAVFFVPLRAKIAVGQENHPQKAKFRKRNFNLITTKWQH